MNTSKSLDSILKNLTFIVGMAHIKVFNGQITTEESVERTKAELTTAKQAIVEAVEGLIPPEHGSYSHIESDNQAKGWNQCRDKMLQAIKEWQ